MVAVSALFSLSAVAFAGGSTPQTPAFENNSGAKKETPRKQASPEEIATYMKKLEKAQERDHDLVVTFTDKSLSESCYYPTSKLDKWLIENPEVVIDRKDFQTPMPFKWGHGDGKGNNGCYTVIVAHYHKVIKRETKKNKK